MVSWTVHLDMRAPSFGTPAPELYRAALDLAAWADEHGVQSIAVSEHGEEDGTCQPAGHGGCGGRPPSGPSSRSTRWR